jgi:glycosyltransferase involved in cell wall biosynthesis
LVQAVKLLRSDHPDLLLVLTRQGQYTDELRDYTAAQGMTDQVRFTGDLEEPYVAVQVCDLMTHITYGDGLPLSILEAMSMGKPVIGSAIGGIPEIIEDGQNGILVTNEPSEIAQAINRLLQDRVLADELGRRGKETVEEKARWETTASIFISLYFDQDHSKG